MYEDRHMNKKETQKENDSKDNKKDKFHNGNTVNKQESDEPEEEAINEYEALLIKAEADIRFHLKVS